MQISAERSGLIRFVGGPAHNKFYCLREWTPAFQFAALAADEACWWLQPPSESHRPLKIETVRYRLQKIRSLRGTVYFEYVLEGKLEGECHPAEFVDGFDLGDVYFELFVAAWNPSRLPPARVQQPFGGGAVLGIGGVVVAKLLSCSIDFAAGADISAGQMVYVDASGKVKPLKGKDA